MHIIQIIDILLFSVLLNDFNNVISGFNRIV